MYVTASEVARFSSISANAITKRTCQVYQEIG